MAHLSYLAVLCSLISVTYTPNGTRSLVRAKIVVSPKVLGLYLSRVKRAYEGSPRTKAKGANTAAIVSELPQAIARDRMIGILNLLLFQPSALRSGVGNSGAKLIGCTGYDPVSPECDSGVLDQLDEHPIQRQGCRNLVAL